MAKRRHKKSKTHRRRRVSGISKNDTLYMIVGAAAGYFFGQTLNDKLTHTADPAVPTDKNGILHSVDPKLLAAGELLIGWFGPNALPPKFKMAGKIAGGLLMGAGIHEGLKAFGVVSGIPVISGYRDMRKISGINMPQRLQVQESMDNSSSITGIQVLSGIYGK
jgi:hypothetical protein